LQLHFRDISTFVHYSDIKHAWNARREREENIGSSLFRNFRFDDNAILLKFHVTKLKGTFLCWFALFSIWIGRAILSDIKKIFLIGIVLLLQKLIVFVNILQNELQSIKSVTDSNALSQENVWSKVTKKSSYCNSKWIV